WNNHHHLLQGVDRVPGVALWANAHLLFWLSLTPVAAAWLGPHVSDSTPVAVYGVVLLGSGIAYWILTHTLIAADGPESRLAQAIGRDTKGKLSLVAYLAAVAVAPALPWISIGLYIAVAAAWFAPDRRVERVLTSTSRASH